MWILIITLWTIPNQVSNPTISMHSIEFSSRESCIENGAKIKFPSGGANNRIYRVLQCVKK